MLKVERLSHNTRRDSNIGGRLGLFMENIISWWEVQPYPVQYLVSRTRGIIAKPRKSSEIVAIPRGRSNACTTQEVFICYMVPPETGDEIYSLI